MDDLMGPIATISPSLLWYVGIIAGVYVALAFVGGPILVRFTLRRGIGLEPFDINSGELPAQVQQHFWETYQTLAEDGYQAAAYLVDAESSGMRLYLAVFENTSSQDLALAACPVARIGGRLVPKTYIVAFATDYTDGTKITTTNTPDVPSVASIPKRKKFHFPEVTDPRRLGRIHQGLCSRVGGMTKRRISTSQTVREVLTADMTKEMEEQVEIGYFYHDETSGSYRPTWKGAFLMVWKQVWPIGTIRKCIGRARNAALLRELGV